MIRLNQAYQHFFYMGTYENKKPLIEKKREQRVLRAGALLG